MRFLALASCVLLSTLPATAQDQPPVFRTETTLIELTLIALDKDGNAVTDLKKEEIVVRDQGRRRELALFRYEGGKQARTVTPLQPGIFTNTVDLTPGPPRNITAIVLDTLNTQPRHQVWVKAQAMRHLSKLVPNTRVAVYLLGRNLAVLHDFADDAESLRAQLERVELQQAAPTLGFIDDMAREMQVLIDWLWDQGLPDKMITRLLQVERLAHESADEWRTRTTLALLEALGDHLAGIPGRKSIVWFGSGITMLSITGSLEPDTPGSQRSYEELIRDTSRRLAQQGITMYMFDARGLQGDPNTSVDLSRVSTVYQLDPYERVKANAAISADTTPAMAKFADIAGGRFFWNTNDMGRAVAAIKADSEGTYSLGFYTDDEPDDKWHRLDVRVKRKGVKLRHRNGYSSNRAPGAPQAWTDDRWNAAVYNPVSSTAVRLDARFQLREDADAKTISMVMLIEAKDLHFRQVDRQSSAAVDMAIIDKLPNARYEMQRDQVEVPFPEDQDGEFAVVRHTWKLTPGATTIRLIVLDRLSGRYGTLDVPVSQVPGAQPALERSGTPQ